MRLDVKTGEKIADCPIALACTSFQPGSVENRHAAIRVPDDALLLQGAGNRIHRRPRGPQHRRQEFLAELKLVGADTVMRHQQPSAAAALQRVQGQARCRLHHQPNHALSIAQDMVAEGASTVELALKHLHRNRCGRRARNLDHGLTISHGSPRNALIPTKPSAPTVATSTDEPSLIVVVIDTTPPSGKIISAIGSLGLWRTSFAVNVKGRSEGASRFELLVRQCGQDAVCRPAGVLEASGGPRMLKRTAFGGGRVRDDFYSGRPQRSGGRHLRVRTSDELRRPVPGVQRG